MVEEPHGVRSAVSGHLTELAFAGPDVGGSCSLLDVHSVGKLPKSRLFRNLSKLFLKINRLQELRAAVANDLADSEHQTVSIVGDIVSNCLRYNEGM